MVRLSTSREELLGLQGHWEAKWKLQEAAILSLSSSTHSSNCNVQQVSADRPNLSPVEDTPRDTVKPSQGTALQGDSPAEGQAGQDAKSQMQASEQAGNQKHEEASLDSLARRLAHVEGYLRCTTDFLVRWDARGLITRY